MIYTYLLILFSLVLELIGSDGIQIVNVDTLDAHNAYRKKHHVPPLQIEPKLNEVSQRWANHLAETGKMQHSSNGYGENIFAIWPVENDLGNKELGIIAVESWYGEVRYYDFNESRENMDFEKIGHLTQILWKNSKHLGQGAAKSTDDILYVVCNYDPPGNVLGQFKENVFAEMTNTSSAGQSQQTSTNEQLKSTTKITNTSAGQSQLTPVNGTYSLTESLTKHVNLTKLTVHVNMYEY